MKFVCILFVLISFGIQIKAATFTVLNNSNAGAGSLRQAISDANANGIATLDNIIFNIPALTIDDATISLTTELPPLSANLIIDATTQPSALFGSTSIKIKLVRASGIFYHGLVIDGVENIQIYGIYFSNFLSQTGVPADERKAGVFLKNASHITIGSPNKQNCFGGNYTSVISPATPSNLDDITVSANIIGLDPTGLIVAANVVGIDLSYLKNSTIGGLDASFGNLISANSNAVSLGGLSGTINVSFNVIGLDITKTKNFPSELATGIFANGQNANVVITDNMIVSQQKGIMIDNIKGGYRVTRNTIGTALANQDFGNTKYGIELYNCGAGVIGGASITAQNVIAYNEQAIQVDFSYPVSILKNSIFCNRKSAIEFKDLPDGKTITPSRINTITANSASGIYLPNATVELFYDDECPDCQGKYWIATLQTDASGNWQYNGPLTGGLTSTGTNPDGATSGFSKPLISDVSKKIADAYCGAANGSITGLTISDASVFTWLNAANEQVGNTKDLTNVPAGTYYLKAGQPGGCDVLSASYTIKNIAVNYKVKASTIIPASCNEKNGSITVLGYETESPTVFTWSDEKGNVVGNTEMLENVFAGNYTLTASNGSSCTNVAGVFSVGITSPPIINLSKMQQFISCDGKTISTSGIEIVGNTAPYAYNWINADGNTVFEGLNIENIKPDKYTLTVTDKFGCTVSTESIDFTQLENKVLLVPNSITPNGDGTNDTWKIAGAANYPDAEFYVFNRNGDKVFYSKGYGKEFDGTHNGKPLSVGVYYYLIDLKTTCGKLTGSLTILK
ncbi:gliding motility-associated C-terminal domain-containing protein [Pedobacter aquatilis]|uniref:gliding motility-associated C-terminal domain-containing protein n=1 Tax=Pedobacter aquatilis TaxID=351343 RepID=UPI00292F1ABF|nr:gliding motility-associated C-terminal domain-containing protein [Pedobacter aquatilis]